MKFSNDKSYKSRNPTIHTGAMMKILMNIMWEFKFILSLWMSV